MSLISLHAASFSLPDGTPLFDNINLSFGPGRTGLIGRNGIGKSTLLDLMEGSAEPASGSVAREGRIRRLRQEMPGDPRATVADAFGMKDRLDRLKRALAGEGSADDIADIDWTLDERLAAALERVGLAGLDADVPQSQLSGGQRTRLALAALTFDAPDMILLDEPTNNLDRDGRALVIDLMDQWRGGAVVVSHDRELLRHMDRIVELSSLGLKSYGGNWDDYRQQKEVERQAAERAFQSAESAADAARRQAQITQERQERRAATGRRARAKGDAPKILLDARAERAEGTATHNRQIAGRRESELARKVAEADAARERFRTLDLSLPSPGLAASRQMLAFEGVTAGYDTARPVLRNVSFAIAGPERVAITGPNGSGKTTLLKLATGAMEPISGLVRRPVPAALLDQHASLLDPALTILENFRRINPGDGDNACRAALARFLFRAAAAEKPVAVLSGGEKLRAALACITGGGEPPLLLILDEPTNHLDLDSIAAMEAGLNGFRGALLVVSHDEDFLRAIGIGRHIRLRNGNATEDFTGSVSSGNR
jgi:ATPase subunit of ABC transporter with duplicated ATPase domains